MGFRMANVDGRAALVSGELFYDIETLSQGSVASDPMLALARSSAEQDQLPQDWVSVCVCAFNFS